MKTFLKVLAWILGIGAVVALAMVITSSCLEMNFVDYAKDCVWPGIKQIFSKPL